MIEVELKYSIPYINSEINCLKKMSEKQVSDIYYDTQDYQLLRTGDFLRARGNNIDFKLFADDLSHTYCEELSFNIDSFNDNNSKLYNILINRMGFGGNFKCFDEFIYKNKLVILSKISRIRKQYLADDEIILTIDDVIDLGYYLEIEKTFSDKNQIDIEHEKKVLESFLYSKNLLPDDSVYLPIGYVELFLKKYNPEAYRLGKYILPEDR